MKYKLTFILAAGILGIGSEDDPGWLAEALASQDKDVEAAVVAYEAGELDAASTRLDAAVARRGERAELHYDRGLVLLAQGDTEAARAAFEHGTESRELGVVASSHYELGNLAMIAEDWEGAIAAYIACLKAAPTHQNAKWNLELALQRKAEQEKEEQEQQDQDQDNQDQNQDGEEGEQNQDQEPGEEGEQDQEQEPGENNQDQEQGEQEPQEQEQGDQGDPSEDEQQQQEQPQPEPGEEQEQEAQPQPIEAGELDAALDELDRQDAFMFGRPRGQQRKVDKDW